MTVIAYDPETQSIACDSLYTAGDEKGYIKKWRVLKDGRVAMICGTFHYGLRALPFIEAKKTIPLKLTLEACIVVFNPKTGKVVWYDEESFTNVPHRTSRKYAWGTGSSYAMGSLMTGGDAEFAARVAAEHSSTCGGKIHVFRRQDANPSGTRTGSVPVRTQPNSEEHSGQ